MGIVDGRPLFLQRHAVPKETALGSFKDASPSSLNSGARRCRGGGLAVFRCGGRL